jgi:hypothetical protein
MPGVWTFHLEVQALDHQLYSNYRKEKKKDKSKTNQTETTKKKKKPAYQSQ